MLDGEDLATVEGGSFDAVISRVGLIYFPDQQRALAGMRRALRPGGRVAAIVYSTPERNGFFSIPVVDHPPPRRSCRRRRPGQPGPFSLGGAGRARGGLPSARASRDVEHGPCRRRCGMASAAECVRFERESFGALHQMLAGLDPAGQEAAAGTRSRASCGSSRARRGPRTPARSGIRRSDCAEVPGPTAFMSNGSRSPGCGT